LGGKSVSFTARFYRNAAWGAGIGGKYRPKPAHFHARGVAIVGMPLFNIKNSKYDLII
jgi:hypothetical protein